MNTKYNVQVFLFGAFTGFQYPVNPSDIGSNRLFHKYVFALRNGILKMLGPKTRSGAKKNYIREIDHMLEGIKIVEFVLFIVFCVLTVCNILQITFWVKQFSE